MCTLYARSRSKRTPEMAKGLIGIDGFLQFRLVPFRRFDAEQMMDEEILEQSLAVSASRSVPASRNQEQVELLVGLDQRIDYLQR